MDFLEEGKPYNESLDEGVRNVISQYASHLKHIETGTVIKNFVSKVICINDEIVVKYGTNVTIGEVNALRFVKEHTSVPVPKVLGFHEDEPGCKYVVMEYIKGSELSLVWDSLTDQQKRKYAKQLKPLFEELHSVKGAYIGGIGKLPPQHRMFKGAYDKGPYESEHCMNEAILRAKRTIWKAYGGSPPELFIRCTLPWLSENHNIILSHGSVNLSHVIVDTEGEAIAGITGWSSAGFFPEYWDYTWAQFYENWLSDFVQYIPDFLKPYHDEFAMWFPIGRMSLSWYKGL